MSERPAIYFGLLILIAGSLPFPAAALGEEAFHSGSVGKCDACHVRRKSVAVATGTGGAEATNLKPVDAGMEFVKPAADADVTGGGFALAGSDAGSTCLYCHETSLESLPREQHVSTADKLVRGGVPPLNLSPAGDFGWLKKSYSWAVVGGRLETSLGDRHGHNVVARDFRYLPDLTLPAAPGGTYPSRQLSCISCHDPHGNYRRGADGAIVTTGLPVINSGSYATSPIPDGRTSVGSYRMLAGRGYAPQSGPPDVVFTADPPAAMAPRSYNRSERTSDTRVAYGSGMSEWCLNCHPDMLDEAAQGTHGHPSGKGARLPARIISMYNSYVGSGDMGGQAATSYTSLVPYETGSSDYASLMAMASSDGSVRNGPDPAHGTPNVMCLTCHRAHASGWDHMMRWNAESEFIVYDKRYPGIDSGAPAHFAQGRTAGEVQRAYYERSARSFAAFQRSLCNKCHARD